MKKISCNYLVCVGRKQKLAEEKRSSLFCRSISTGEEKKVL
jgi:hypothetical protein